MRQLKAMGIISKTFRDLKNPASYSGVSSIAKATGKTYEEARRELAGDFASSLHKPRRYKFRRLATVPRGYYSDLQVDLADFRGLSSFNKGYKYCLIGVDVLSRRFFAVPVKSKKSDDMCEAFKKLFKQMPRFPEVVFSDKGLEFTQKRLKSLLESKHIQKWHGENDDIKAAVAERAIRTLKNRLFRFLTAESSKNWIKPLGRIIQNINHSVCRTTGMRPVDVTEENWKELWERLYGNQSFKKKQQNTARFYIGDFVRIAKKKDAFDKSHFGFTDEVFRIIHENNSNPATFVLEDLEGNEINGKFYAPELSLSREDTEYRIEKVLKTRQRNGRTEHYVKWKGFPSSKNSWIVLE